MIEQLNEIDTKLFFLLNGNHNPWLDSVMYNLTQTLFWVPLYVVLLYIILNDFRNDSWAPLLGIMITILIADQAASSVIKPLFQRLRPTHNPDIQALVQTVGGYRGGKFGFVSSHAANTFGTTIFFLKLLPGRKPWLYMLFIWVGLVSYSRVYLGVHYPGDMIGGWLVGTGAAVLGFRGYEMLYKKFGRNKSLGTRQ